MEIEAGIVPVIEVVERSISLSDDRSEELEARVASGFVRVCPLTMRFCKEV